MRRRLLPAVWALLAVLAAAWAWPPSCPAAANPASTAPPELVIAAPTPEVQALVREIVESAAPKLTTWLGAGPRRIQVRVAGSQREFAEEMERVGGPLWAAGLALPEQGLILVRSPGQLTQPEEFRSLLIHELTHLHLWAAMPRREHPLWLEEGLAMYTAGETSLGRGTVMAEAVLQKRLLNLNDLEHRFPADPDQAALAYAQSYYFVVYLLGQYGPDTLRKLTASLARGRDLTTALYEATGKGLYSLNQDFAAAMESRFSWIALATAGGALWAVASVVAAVGLVRRRRVHKARMAAMDDPGQEKVHRLERNWPPPESPGDALKEAGLGRSPGLDKNNNGGPSGRGRREGD